MIVIVIGVVGSGKTTVGRLLAEQLGWEFADADDFHSPANVEKIRKGIGLTDADREPWLQSLRDSDRPVDRQAAQRGPRLLRPEALLPFGT
jgi:carbohydrate kinase (thermoresistant glucokinase family)